MKPEFLDNVSTFLSKLKQDSEKFKGDDTFETLMRGLSNGTINFRWGFGGRLVHHHKPIEKPNFIWVRWLISAPFIYAMVFILVLLDLSVSLYQSICFRLWRIPQIQRSKHVIIDRHRLTYLNGFQKLNCIYCGYANGVMGYAKHIAGETERYWCPVKHETEVLAPHNYYIEFADFDDLEGWNAIHSTGLSNWGNQA